MVRARPTDAVFLDTFTAQSGPRADDGNYTEGGLMAEVIFSQ